MPVYESARPRSALPHRRSGVAAAVEGDRTEQLAVVQGGLLRSLRLTHTGAETFFTLPELMAANLRALLAAYAGLWAFPAPAEVPTNLRAPEVRLELRRRLAPVQLELFGPAPVA